MCNKRTEDVLVELSPKETVINTFSGSRQVCCIFKNTDINQVIMNYYLFL